jgi:hypothetical protein
MGGRPKAHKTDYNHEDDVSHYRLNLSDPQLDEVATKLALPNADRQRLATGQEPPPYDGAIMLTYRGRYVRITYKGGQIDTITPPDLKYQD